MNRRRAALSLGSNSGDRLAHLQAAAASLTGAVEVDVVAVSPVVETDPVGGPDQADYLNAVVVVDTTLTPEDLLALAHRIEDAAGRAREVRWGPRTLDVDVLAVGDLTRSTADLQLPHPRAHERAFVLQPWRRVDPDFVLVGHGRVADLADAVGDSGVRPTALTLLAAP